MRLNLSDSLVRRIKLVIALITAYTTSFLILECFFIANTPNLNPQGFQLLGEKAQNLNVSIRTYLEQLQTSSGLPPPPAPSVPIPQQTIFPTFPPPGNPLPTAPINFPTSQPPLPPSIAPIPPTIYIPRPSVTALPRPSSTPMPPPPTAIPTVPKTKVSYADFGKCLNDNGMVMYMTATCGLCSQQKKTLKDAVNYIKLVDCNASQANGLECSQVGVRGLPTWAKNGKAVLAGPQTNETLAQTAGCQAPTQ